MEAARLNVCPTLRACLAQRKRPWRSYFRRDALDGTEIHERVVAPVRRCMRDRSRDAIRDLPCLFESGLTPDLKAAQRVEVVEDECPAGESSSTRIGEEVLDVTCPPHLRQSVSRAGAVRALRWRAGTSRTDHI